MNSETIDQALERRAKYDSLEEFLDAEIRTPMRGVKTEYKDSVIDYYYLPQSYMKGLRCYCSLVQDLPADETISPTYCNCSKGYVTTYWEKVTGRPVEVELMESAVSGSDRCWFRIRIR